MSANGHKLRLESSTLQKPNAHHKWNSIAFRYDALNAYCFVNHSNNNHALAEVSCKQARTFNHRNPVFCWFSVFECFFFSLSQASLLCSCVQFIFAFKMNVQSLNISIQQRRLIEKVKLMQKKSIFDSFMDAYFNNNSYEQICILWKQFRQTLTCNTSKRFFFFCSLNSCLLFGRKNLHLEFAICKTVSTKMAICNHKNYWFSTNHKRFLLVLKFFSIVFFLFFFK